VAAIGIAFALTQDQRATTLHIASAWTVVGFSIWPLARMLAGTGRAAVADAVAAGGVLVATVGCYTIGGLAFGVPALLLIAAASVRHESADKIAGPSEAGRPQLIVATGIACIGAFLGLSMTAVAFAGYGLSLVAISLFGRMLSARRRRAARRSGVGWLQAAGIVLGLNALAWSITIALASIL